MVRDIVLVLEGGCMLGAFGAGVLTAMQRADLYHRIHSVYAVSAGAPMGAYFLTRRSERGARIYSEDLTDTRLLDFGKWRRYALDIMRGAPEKTNLLDLEYVRHIGLRKRRLSLSRLRRSKIAFYVQVVDVDTGEVLFLDGKDEQSILASCSAAPLYTKPVEVGGRRFVDGLRISREMLLRIRREHRGKTIIYILNDSPQPRSWIAGLYGAIYQFLHSLLLYAIFGRNVAIANWRTVGWERHKAARLRNVVLVANRKQASKFCTERKRIASIYRHGVERGIKLAASLQKPSLLRE